jgi:hypothetical protein
LDLDDDHPDGEVAVEKDDHGVGAVFGGPDLGQVGRGEAGFGVGRKRDAQRLHQHLGGERRAMLKRSTKISWSIEGMAAMFLFRDLLSLSTGSPDS